MKDRIITWGGVGILVVLDVWLWCFPLPVWAERRQFMSNCITARGTAIEAQRECYASFQRYEDLKRRDFIPEGEEGAGHVEGR